MNKYNLLTANRLGGGNSNESELAPRQDVLIQGRIASFYKAMLFVLFAFLGSYTLTSCKSDTLENMDESTNITTVDYKVLFTAHVWEIAEADQPLGSLWVDIKDGEAYCRFTTDSIFFSEGEMISYFDDEGKVTKEQYELTPCGKYAYALKDDKIKIDNDIFMIKGNADFLTLQNKDWKLVLKKNNVK